ncbi:MAG: hypothetical protein M1461_07220 [Nitrospirae bacterium]|nr:hypothetical protein [Nitrospirota bacterium]
MVKLSGDIMLSKSILRQISGLNILLFAALIAFAAYTLPLFLDVKANFVLPSPKKEVGEKQEKAEEPQAPSIAEYAVIAEQNVFNPERKIPSEKKDEQPLPKPEFVLYGTLIAGDASLAFMEDLKSPTTSQGKGKRQRALRLGAALSGYTLSEVHHERVVMLKGDERIEVRVSDRQHKKARGDGNTSAVKAADAPKAVQVPGEQKRFPGMKQGGSHGSGQ